LLCKILLMLRFSPNPQLKYFYMSLILLSDPGIPLQMLRNALDFVIGLLDNENVGKSKFLSINSYLSWIM
jgi:hypothetical protein